MRFAQVADIEVLRPVEGEQPCVVPTPKSAGQRIIVTLNSAKTPMVFIDTHDSPLFAKYVVCAWQSYKILTNARVGHLNNCANVALAQQYMNEISQELRETGKDDLSRYAEIFDELALEVRCDLHLKEVIFRSGEIVVQTIVILQSMLHSPTGLERQVAARIKFVASQSQPSSPLKSVSAASFSFDPASVSAAASKNAAAELANRLNKIIEERLWVVKCAFNLLTSLLLCSEGISSRTNMLVGPPPLDLDSWFSVLVPDLFSLMTERFGGGGSFAPPSDGDSELTNFNQSKLGEYSEASGAERKSLVDAILTPLRKKDASAEAAAAARNLGPRLVFMRRGVADLQIVLLMEVCRVGLVDYRQQPPGRSRVDLMYGPQRVMAPVGETYVRQDDWEGSLEKVVMRLSGLLDDMLITERTERRRNGGDTGFDVPLGIPQTKGPAKPPRRGGNGGVDAGEAASSSEPRGPLETNEILLFCGSNMIRTLAWESPKIREVLAGDLLPLLQQILTVMNIMCPRTVPSTPHHPTSLQYGASGSSSAPGFLNCFQSRKEESATDEGSTNPLVGPRPLDDELFPRISISAYGPPSQLPGLSNSSWLLLVLSRRCIEETVNSLCLSTSSAFFKSAAQVRAVRPDGISASILEVTPRFPAISRSAAKRGSDTDQEATRSLTAVSTAKKPLGLFVVTADDDHETENMALLNLREQHDTLPSESDNENARLLILRER